MNQTLLITKSMGLDYMKFGRYGKDGKVTHKSIGGNLTPC